MLPALIVGALTAWYLGLRAGIIAAAVTLASLIVADFVPVPGVKLAIYALVLAWSGAVYFLGGKITQRTAQPSWFSGVSGQAQSLVRKFLKNQSK
jgi:hypothetical protein